MGFNHSSVHIWHFELLVGLNYSYGIHAWNSWMIRRINITAEWQCCSYQFPCLLCWWNFYLFRLCCLSALVYKISETLGLPCTGCLHIAVLLGDRHRSSILGIPCWSEHVHTALEIQKDLLGAWNLKVCLSNVTKTSVASAARLLDEFSAALKFLQSMSIQ